MLHIIRICHGTRDWCWLRVPSWVRPRPPIRYNVLLILRWYTVRPVPPQTPGAARKRLGKWGWDCQLTPSRGVSCVTLRTMTIRRFRKWPKKGFVAHRWTKSSWTGWRTRFGVEELQRGWTHLRVRHRKPYSSWIHRTYSFRFMSPRVMIGMGRGRWEHKIVRGARLGNTRWLGRQLRACWRFILNGPITRQG